MNKAVCSASAGFLAAAATAAIGLSASATFTTAEIDLEVVAMWAVVYFPLALVAVLVLGLPAFLALSPLAPGRWWMPLVAGAVLGVPLVLFLQPMSTGSAPLFISLSALSALVFWLVWRWLSERECAC